MRANDPNTMPPLLADWIAILIVTQPVLHAQKALQSFMAYIADEDINSVYDLTTLFTEWRAWYTQ